MSIVAEHVFLIVVTLPLLIIVLLNAWLAVSGERRKLTVPTEPGWARTERVYPVAEVVDTEAHAG